MSDEVWQALCKLEQRIVALEAKDKVTRFKPPTEAELVAYQEELGSCVDISGFINYNESKGWKVGSQKMKSWKAAFRNARKWECNKAREVEASQGSLFDRLKRGK